MSGEYRQEHTVLEDDIVFPRAVALEKAADSYYISGNQPQSGS